jgi:ligand-binding sensor domain-containing protein
MKRQQINIIFLLSIILLFPFVFIYPQNKPKILPLSQSVEGLSSPVVLTVLKDSHGFMWFGTQSGLYRYDGYEFEHYQYDPGDTTTISNSTIWRILCEDKKGYLWIASFDQVLNRYDFHNNKFKRYNLKSMVANQKRWIDKAYPDTHGNIWFIPNDFGIIKYSSSTDEFSKSYPVPDDLENKSNIIKTSTKLLIYLTKKMT